MQLLQVVGWIYTLISADAHRTRVSGPVSSRAKSLSRGRSPPRVGPVPGLSNGTGRLDRETRRLVRSELGRCIQPRIDEDMQGDIAWFSQLQDAVKGLLAEPADGPHVQTVDKPLEGIVESIAGDTTGEWFATNVIPWHRAVTLNTDPPTETPEDMDYPDARCFDFNYTAKPGSEPDPYGCGLFRFSFMRLKGLRQCIVGELGKSRRWQMYRHVAGSRVADRRDEENLSSNELVWKFEMGDEEQAEWEYVKSHMGWEFDANTRADEMTKYVGFHDKDNALKGMDSGIIEWADRKIKETLTGIELEPEVVSDIRQTCFKVRTDNYGTWDTEAQTLHHVLPCLPLMWDTVEVGGNPHKPVNNAVNLFNEQENKHKVTVKEDFPLTAPVCGRLALGLMLHPLVHTATGQYQAVACLHGQTSWSSCTSLKTYNCICFEKCWVSALKRICAMANQCCADVEKAEGYDSILRTDSFGRSERRHAKRMDGRATKTGTNSRRRVFASDLVEHLSLANASKVPINKGINWHNAFEVEMTQHPTPGPSDAINEIAGAAGDAMNKISGLTGEFVMAAI